MEDAARQSKHLIIDSAVSALNRSVRELEDFIDGLLRQPKLESETEGINKSPIPTWIEVYQTLSSRILESVARLEKLQIVLRETLL